MKTRDIQEDSEYVLNSDEMAEALDQMELCDGDPDAMLGYVMRNYFKI